MQSLVNPPRWNYAVLLLIPGILTALNPNWLFQNIGTADPWFYFGAFVRFPAMHEVLPSYATERLTWILPGYLLVKILGHVPGVMALHVITVLVSVFSLYAVVRRISDPRTALLSAVLLGINPFFIANNGWDHPNGVAIAYMLLSLALARPGTVWLWLSGMAWIAVGFTYLPWILFTPAYIWLASRLAGRGVLRPALGGAATMTVALSVAWAAFGMKGFFFARNIGFGLEYASAAVNPWVDPNWMRNPTWLVLPALAAALSVLYLVRDSDLMPILGFYRFCLAVMLVMSFLPMRILTIEHCASILIPGVFITLAVTLLRVPDSTRPLQFAAVAAAAAILCLAPLARVNLYRIAANKATVAVLVLGLLAVGVALMRSRTTPLWAAAVLLFAALNFGVLPQEPGIVWRHVYRGRDISERVSLAMKTIAGRLPADRYPVFWVDTSDFHWSEPMAIMYSFASHNESMRHFPRVDERYPVGTPIFMITPSKDEPVAAAATLKKAGMPVELVTQDRIEYGGVSYWATQMVVVVP